MTMKILMPAFSSTMESGKLLSWLVEEGAAVNKGDLLAEVETDKAVAEVEAPSAGTLARILVPAGDADVAVNTPIAELTTEQGAGAGDEPPEAPAAPPAATAHSRERHAVGREAPAEATVRASPAARHAAREAGIALAAVAGSGPQGRISRADIERYLAHREGQSPETDAAGGRRHHLRQAVARTMEHAKRTVPHFYAETEVLVDALLAAKEALGRDLPEERVTLTAFIVHAAAQALIEVPAVNVSWQNDAPAARSTIDIGVAVAVEGGVVVPVIRGAGALSLRAIAGELARLTAAAREDRLRQSDLGDASLTISNLGMYAIDRFFPVVNPPESMIVGIGRARRVASVDDERSGARTVMSCSFAVDHRAVDGALCGLFAGALKTRLERPEAL